MTSMIKSTFYFLLLFTLLFLLLLGVCNAAPIPITGTLRDPSGNLANGTITFQLPFAGAKDSTTAPNTILTTAPIRFYVINGQVQATSYPSTAPLQARLVANGDILPSGTHYNVLLASNGYTSTFNVVIPSGASFDLGSATQTSIVSSQVSYSRPADLSLANTFSALQSFTSGFKSLLISGLDYPATNSISITSGNPNGLGGNGGDINIHATNATGLFAGGSINLTPGAGAGSAGTINFLGRLGKFNQISTCGNGFSYGCADATIQGSNIGSTTLYPVPASGAGLYLVSCYIVVTRVATTSSTLPACNITWTDVDNGAVQSQVLASPNTGNLITTLTQGNAVISASAGTNIQYSTSGFASVGATSMQYAVHLRVEAL